MKNKPVRKLPKGTLLTNEGYTALLKETYPEADVKPLERYISPQATLLHKCNSCSTTWFDKPSNLINQSHTVLGHVCNEPIYFRLGHGVKSKVTEHKIKRSDKNAEEMDKLADAIQLISVGYSVTEVAEYLEIQPKIITWWADKLRIEAKKEEVEKKGYGNSSNTYGKKRQAVREMLETAREVAGLLAQQDFAQLDEEDKREKF